MTRTKERGGLKLPHPGLVRYVALGIGLLAMGCNMHPSTIGNDNTVDGGAPSDGSGPVTVSYSLVGENAGSPYEVDKGDSFDITVNVDSYPIGQVTSVALTFPGTMCSSLMNVGGDTWQSTCVAPSSPGEYAFTLQASTASGVLPASAPTIVSVNDPDSFAQELQEAVVGCNSTDAAECGPSALEAEGSHQGFDTNYMSSAELANFVDIATQNGVLLALPVRGGRVRVGTVVSIETTLNFDWGFLGPKGSIGGGFKGQRKAFTDVYVICKNTNPIDFFPEATGANAGQKLPANDCIYFGALSTEFEVTRIVELTVGNNFIVAGSSLKAKSMDGTAIRGTAISEKVDAGGKTIDDIEAEITKFAEAPETAAAVNTTIKAAWGMNNLKLQVNYQLGCWSWGTSWRTATINQWILSWCSGGESYPVQTIEGDWAFVSETRCHSLPDFITAPFTWGRSDYTSCNFQPGADVRGPGRTTWRGDRKVNGKVRTQVKTTSAFTGAFFGPFPGKP